MLRVLGCVTEQHDLRLVVLAGLVCFFACFTAMGLVMRARDTARLRVLWLLGAGTVAGAGIWATHFVAMLAYQGHLPIGYEFGGTLLSVAIAVAVSTIGFTIALRPKMGLLGGAVLGAAIALMHFVGMSALHMPARIEWDASYVVASILLGIVGSMAALHVVAGAGSWRGQLSAATLLTLAICALHFTAMAAVTLIPLYAAPVAGAVLAPTSLAVAVATTTLLIVGIGFASAIVDRHLESRAVKEADRLRAHIVELEATKEKLEQTSANLATALEAADAGNKAKSLFLAAMSHELRTPLNAILGFSEMIRNEPFGPLGDAQYADYVADIHKSGKHLLALINDVLDLSRLDEGHIELDEHDFDLGEAVKQALAMMDHQTHAGNIRVVNNISGAPLNVRADRRRLLQIVLNLLSNAVKFTPADGTVSVDATVGDDGLLLTVSDSGIGMRPDEIRTALEPFGQVDARLSRKYEGAGLGLPLAKQLIELHGGSLLIDSIPGKGTMVGVQLPLRRLNREQQAA